jgi:hypothetical protein
MKNIKISFISYDLRPLDNQHPAARIRRKRQKKDKEGYTCEKKFHYQATKIISVSPLGHLLSTGPFLPLTTDSNLMYKGLE